MARFNAMDVTWEKVDVLGKEGLFTCLRVDKTTIPKGWYFYEVRHDDFYYDEPIEIALGVLANHWGTLIMVEPLELIPEPNLHNAYLDIDPERDWAYLGEDVRF